MDKVEQNVETVEETVENNEFLSLLESQFGLSQDELDEIGKELTNEQPTTEENVNETVEETNETSNDVEEVEEVEETVEEKPKEEKPKQDSKVNKAFKEYREKIEAKDKQINDILEAFGIDSTDELAVRTFFDNVKEFKVQRKAEKEGKQPDEIKKIEEITEKERLLLEKERNLALREVREELIGEFELKLDEVNQFIDELDTNGIDILESKLTPKQLFRALKSDVIEKKREEKRKREETERIKKNTATTVRATTPNDTIQDDDMSNFMELLKTKGY